MSTAAYIRRETGVSMVINAVLTLAFFLLVFGRGGAVPVWGVGAYVFDFVPQGFMIGLMGSLVPGALAGKARRAGKVAALGVASPWPANLILRSLLLALCGALAGVVLSGAALTLLGLVRLPWGAGLAAKLVWAGLLAAMVTPVSLRKALA
ncbi:hypothetical protein [Novosphingobium humi]|uniref:Tripartite tricarboxylate transporter TctB family protein n=1 Tax=Novosphingobium humi TaxID=2282397 RepID=A0ABY7TWS3_9SPHN|nr:hypothetical protein [Novosphingobium humi]WCT76810.1 hypothetical protein PQ457_12860 [Novosphingobium humi]